MNSGKKKGLGRGLSALFGDDKPKDNKPEISQFSTVAISDLSRNPYQPRQTFSEEKLEELAKSIKKNGIIQPIAVRPNKSENGKSNQYTVSKDTSVDLSSASDGTEDGVFLFPFNKRYAKITKKEE